MKYIKVTNRKHEVVGVAKVSDEDFAAVSQYNWTHHNGGYVCAKIDGRMTLLHRFIMARKFGCEGFRFVDHINHDKYDNRRENLRIADDVTNARNRQKTAGCVCRYKGVTRRTLKSGEYRYIARVFVNHKVHYGGSYKTEEEAAMAYNEMAAELFGDFACVNEHIGA